ncbi:MAG: histidinol-phosphate transaminase [Anaerolineae bacterium]|nr:histidinol-phosphate transaminase [Anaerolineae bacterium]
MIDARQVATWIRPDIHQMPAYSPIVPFEVLSQRLGLPAHQIVKVDANENPYGPSPKAVEALANYPYYHIYPDPNHTLLRDALQSYVGVGREHLVFGTGSDELLDVVMRLFIVPGDAIVNCPPTFGMYPFLAGVAGARTHSVPRLADFGLDFDAIEKLFESEAKPPKIVFVASPNNPDGSTLDTAGLLRLLDLPAIVVVDQAYVEFGGTDFSTLVPHHANLVVMRTFSKWAGLAGLRVGYGVFPAPLVPHVLKIKQPYNVNAAAQAAVLASLDDLHLLQSRVQAIVRERTRLYQGLCAIDYLAPYPSQSNFVLSRVLDRDASELKGTLERQGILVRHYRTPGLEDCIRISVGTPEQNGRVLDALRSEVR